MKSVFLGVVLVVSLNAQGANKKCEITRTVGVASGSYVEMNEVGPQFSLFQPSFVGSTEYVKTLLISDESLTSEKFDRHKYCNEKNENPDGVGFEFACVDDGKYDIAGVLGYNRDDESGMYYQTNRSGPNAIPEMGIEFADCH